MAKWAWACFPFGGFALIVKIDHHLNELNALSGNWDVFRDVEWSICRHKSYRKPWGRYILHRASRWYQEAKRRILYGEGIRVIYFLNEINARLKIETEIDECPCDSLSLILLNGNHSLSSLLTLFLLIWSPLAPIRTCDGWRTAAVSHSRNWSRFVRTSFSTIQICFLPTTLRLCLHRISRIQQYPGLRCNTQPTPHFLEGSCYIWMIFDLWWLTLY